MTEHTPTPWRLSHYHYPHSQIVVDNSRDDNDSRAKAEGRLVCEPNSQNMPQYKANADFIVLACNAHAPLVAACEKIERLRGDLLEGATSMDEGALLTEGANAFDDIEAALALAKEDQS